MFLWRTKKNPLKWQTPISTNCFHFLFFFFSLFFIFFFFIQYHSLFMSPLERTRKPFLFWLHMQDNNGIIMVWKDILFFHQKWSVCAFTVDYFLSGTTKVMVIMYRSVTSEIDSVFFKFCTPAFCIILIAKLGQAFNL